MGSIEAEAKRKARKGEIQRLVLETVKVAGLISLAIVAPSVVGAMHKLGILPSKRQDELVRRSCERLVRSGKLKWVKGRLRLTAKGESSLRLLMMQQIGQAKPRTWDFRWRLLIFDIPEYRASLRHKIRDTLQAIGFKHLQDSVWIYPYDCEDLIALLKSDFRVGKDLLYMVVEAIENDAQLRRSFGLKV